MGAGQSNKLRHRSISSHHRRFDVGGSYAFSVDDMNLEEARKQVKKMLIAVGLRESEPEPKEEADAWAEMKEHDTIVREGSTIEENPGDLRE